MRLLKGEVAQDAQPLKEFEVTVVVTTHRTYVKRFLAASKEDAEDAAHDEVRNWEGMEPTTPGDEDWMEDGDAEITETEVEEVEEVQSVKQVITSRQRSVRLLYPEERHMYERDVLRWAHDTMVDNAIKEHVQQYGPIGAPDEPAHLALVRSVEYPTLEHAMEVLEDAGKATFAKEGI